jgi:Uncharacterized conserved protein
VDLMDILIDKIKQLKQAPNSAYYDLKYKFNYHSNKIEGSTFTLENILSLMQYDMVEGEHPFDDIMETRNSLQLFDFVIDTLDERLSKRLLLDYHSILKNNTKDDAYGFKGCFKKIPNMILGTSRKVAQPYEVESRLENLIKEYYELKEIGLKEIAEFHLEFETIHPFQDGNGRIGRFIILKQCLENNIDPILITEDNIVGYRKAMNGTSEDLNRFFYKCERYELLY